MTTTRLFDIEYGRDGAYTMYHPRPSADVESILLDLFTIPVKFRLPNGVVAETTHKFNTIKKWSASEYPLFAFTVDHHRHEGITPIIYFYSFSTKTWYWSPDLLNTSPVLITIVSEGIFKNTYPAKVNLDIMADLCNYPPNISLIPDSKSVLVSPKHYFKTATFATLIEADQMTFLNPWNVEMTKEYIAVSKRRDCNDELLNKIMLIDLIINGDIVLGKHQTDIQSVMESHDLPLSVLDMKLSELTIDNRDKLARRLNHRMESDYTISSKGFMIDGDYTSLSISDLHEMIVSRQV